MEPDNHAVEPLDFAFAVSVIPIVLTDSLEASMALHDLYHGARANKLLFNIRNGSITADSSGKIYFAEREWQNCIVHGADLETGESYVAKFRVDVPPRHDSFLIQGRVTRTQGWLRSHPAHQFQPSSSNCTCAVEEQDNLKCIQSPAPMPSGTRKPSWPAVMAE